LLHLLLMLLLFCSSGTAQEFSPALQTLFDNTSAAAAAHLLP
jgi:hypothetical protein